MDAKTGNKATSCAARHEIGIGVASTYEQEPDGTDPGAPYAELRRPPET